MRSLAGQVLVGDALEVLRTLPDNVVDTVVTSPPYYGLRDYGVKGQIGQEPHVDEWVERLRDVAREIHRVLAPHGCLWLNLGDAYSSHARDGAPPKSLLMAPERVARALLADGWLLRNKAIWWKANPVPTPVRDRLNTSYEPIFFFVKQASYYFDLDAIREPLTSTRRPSRSSASDAGLGRLAGRRDGLARLAREGRSGHPLGKNPGDVWKIASSSDRSAHVAPFPEQLVRRPLLATCPERVCTRCAQPWRRSARPVNFLAGVAQPRPILPCPCGAPTRPGLVLDPFFGTGTVGRVAEELGRDFLGIELNPEYATLARERIAQRRAA